MYQGSLHTFTHNAIHFKAVSNVFAAALTFEGGVGRGMGGGGLL